ncbi:glycosyltransferase family 25 protein [Bradyrhizobium sp. B117]|uniref:glycosyltransferase family 25 protein n=1 Tax=Bradyrhizobium sp. B117 TaxID=3140246 RepID=UPI0031843BDF
MNAELRPTPAGRALANFFSAVRVISLKSRDDRRREMGAELARLGLAPDHGPLKFHDASRFDEAYPFPSIGAKGCYYSHLAVLEEALSKGFENVLILEDDCDFIGNIERALPSALETLGRKDWDFFFGGHEDLICDEGASEPVQQVPSGSWIRGTHFVAFNKRAISAIVPYLRQEIEHLERDPVGASRGIDAAYTHFGREYPMFRYFVAWPKLGYQRPSRTDVQTTSILDRLPLIRSAVVPVRRLKRLLRKRAT